MDIRTAIRNSGFFGTVSEELIDKIVRISREIPCEKNDMLFAEGTPCTGMFIVGEGAVKIFKIGPDGREHVIHVAEPGETFGEAAMFFQKPNYPASASAVKKTRTVFIPKQPMLDLLEDNPALALQVLGSLAEWSHRLVTKLETLTLKDASSRLAGYMIGKASESGERNVEFDLAVPKQVLASQLAVSSETLSRLLNRFEAQELIESEGRHIRIKDPASLQDIADWGAGD